MHWTRFVVLLAGLSAVAVAAEGVPDDVSVYSVPCAAVGTYWPGPGSLEAAGGGPTLAVVDTAVRPRRTRLFLDGSFVGLAGDFDGRPDYLYLQPGRYRLEARLGGYRTAVFEIDAAEACRHGVRHRMERDPGAAKERGGYRAGLTRPVQRIFAPVKAQPAARRQAKVSEAPRRGPDLTLRPNLELRQRPASGGEGARGPAEGASLRIKVVPDKASVYLDGAFLASGEELASMVEPLAVAPGQHVLEILAPGHEPAMSRFELSEGEVREIEILLDARPGEEADAP